MDLQTRTVLLTDPFEKEMPIFTTNNLSSVTENSIPQIKEYERIVIKFHANDLHDRLIIEDLADYQLIGQKVDNNDAMFTAETNFIYVFDFNKQPVPLVPGFYTIKILHGDQIYYSYFEIIPKDLTKPEWREMRTDVESMVNGLASDYVKKHHEKQTKSNKDLDTRTVDNRVEYFLRQFNKIRIAVEKLRNEAKFKVSVKYKWNLPGRARTIDIQSIRKFAERPDKRNYIYTPIHYMEFDVPENRWMKFIISYFRDFCWTSQKYYEHVEQQLEKEYQSEEKFFSRRDQESRNRSSNDFTKNRYERSAQNIEHRIHQLKTYRLYFDEVLSDDFLRNISQRRTSSIPKSLILLPQYNFLYKTFSNLKRKRTFSLAEGYQFYWKQTSKLYEIWGYVKLISLLKKEKFEPISGWIFDKNNGSDALPFLEDKTRVILKGEKVKLILVYNEEIPRGSDKENKQRLLTSSSPRRKPDIRIDMFTMDDHFMGTIIVDTKYMKLHNILSGRKRRKIEEQLTSYKDSIKSNALAIPDSLKKNFSCVHAVYAMYPGSEDAKVPSYMKDYGIYYNRVKPGHGGEEFLKSLVTQIEERQSNYYYFNTDRTFNNI